MSSRQPLLSVKGVHAGYGASQVLFGVDLTIYPGQCVSLQGRNGMGKTTTIRTVMGQLPCAQGEIRFLGEQVNGLPSFQIARMGIGLVPEGRQIFPNLTVRENLIATARAAKHGDRGWDLSRVLTHFERLGERLNHFGNQLSGGEQQMLAIGRALMTNPRLLVLDEATEGLAPVIREEIWQALDMLRAEGLSILITDKNVRQLLERCDHHYILERGVCVWDGSTADFERDDEMLRERYLAT